MSTSDVLSILSHVSIVRDENHYAHRISTLCNTNRPYILSFINQHGFNLAHKDPQLRDALLKSDCLLRDGVGLEIAFQALKLNAGLNCNGTDLIPLVLKQMQGRNIAVFGTRDPWLSKACAELEDAGLNVVSKLEGYENDQVYLAEVRKSAPDLIVLGMGMPRQEILAVKLAKNCDHPCLIINGGAMIDFLACRFVRAPKWIRALRLEWLFRLFLEPKRLFNRYVTGGVTFLVNLVKLMIHARSAPDELRKNLREIENPLPARLDN